MLSGFQLIHPMSGGTVLPIQAAKRRSFAFDEQFLQIFIHTFTDAQKRRLSSRGVLPWNKAEPGCESRPF